MKVIVFDMNKAGNLGRIINGDKNRYPCRQLKELLDF